jgi:RNA-directed DNA polymerase
MLCSKLRGHYQYYGIRGHYKMLEVVMEHVDRAWQHWLSRRGSRHIPWDRFERLRKLFPLPTPRILHPV